MSDYKQDHEGERLSFFKIFSEKHYKIVIPRIQREYAQGRKSENVQEIRTDFLDALYNYLEENIPFRDLDFIYGYINEVKDKGTIVRNDFVPLDGQQRLTTLFLLHWFLYQISDDETLKADFIKNMNIAGESMFSYETRTSSTDFCNALVSNNIDMKKLMKDDSGKDSLSLTIKNKNWYYLMWENDPTIQSMLVMLDAIYLKFQGHAEFFPRLLDSQNPVITFLFMDLRKYKLTDDLYIKMNSRGIPLTPFENFKAKYESYLKTIDKKLEQRFSENVDTTWTNLCWSYRDESDGEHFKKFDDTLTNFIRAIFTNQYASQTDLTLKGKDENLSNLISAKGYLTFNKYKDYEVLSKEGANYLMDAFDALSNGNNNIRIHLSEDYKAFFYEDQIFRNALSNSFTSYGERLALHAYLKFLIKYKSDEGIDDWMRVIHNLCHPDNTIINTASAFANLIQEIDKLLPYAQNILEYVSAGPTINYFSTWQVCEEVIKALLVKKSDRWREAIIALEKHKYFNGQIGFVLEFSGIVDYYKNNGQKCEWSDSEDNTFFKNFEDNAAKASAIFANDYENRINDPDFCFERAVLTKCKVDDDYLSATQDGYRFNLLSTDKVANNVKRDHSWKNLLRLIDGEKENRQRTLVKKLFADSRLDASNIVTSLNEICKDGCPACQWCDLLIKEPRLIAYSQQGFIGFYREDYVIPGIMILKQLYIGMYHTELYTYNLYLQKYENAAIKPFDIIEYECEKVNYEIPYIYFHLVYSRKNYCLEIRADVQDDWSLKSYTLNFRKTSGERRGKDQFSPELVDILFNDLHFKWYDGYDEEAGKYEDMEKWGFQIEVKNDDDAVAKVKELSAQLWLLYQKK